MVPFLVSFPWYLTGWAFFLPLLVVASQVIPYVLMRRTRKLHGAANSRRPPASVGDGDEIAHVAPTPTFGAPPSPPSLWSPTSSYFEGEEENMEVDAGEAGGGEEEGLGNQGGVEMS